MKITVVGTGYVGLVTGACFSEFGINVVCVDKDKSKISNLQQGIIPIYEPGLEELVKKNLQRGSLSFSTDLKESLEGSSVVFIAVGTPSRRGDGHADLVYVFDVIDELASCISDGVTIVTKSTVPVGTGQKIRQYLEEKSLGLNFYMASNPEFLREGAALEDFMNPDRVIIGVDSLESRQSMETLYGSFQSRGIPTIFTSIETAELTKYAANGFLAMKISFINEISDLCEACGANVEEVAKGIGLDKRIGKDFLKPGPGYGGSCFPKDTKALSYTAREYKKPLKLIDAVISINAERKKSMGPRIENILGSLSNKKVGVLGLTFKANTDDMRDSVSLDILPYFIEKGAVVNVYDPKGMKEAKKLLSNFPLNWKSSIKETLHGMDVCIILTEWEEFKLIDWEKVKGSLGSPIVIDLRNLYDPENMKKLEVKYYSLGRL